jgi:leucyl aminopeptidase
MTSSYQKLIVTHLHGYAIIVTSQEILECLLMLKCFSTQSGKMVTITPLMKSNFESWFAGQEAFLQNWVKANKFIADSGSICLVPDQQGKLSQVLAGFGTTDDFWVYGDLPARLPEGDYQAGAIDPRAAVAWGLGSYSFNSYQRKNRKPESGKARLFIPDSANPKRCQHMVESIYWVRDLINTPTEDMSPEVLAQAAIDLAKTYQSTAKVIVGNELLSANYPTIHAVGRGSSRSPRLVDFQWGEPGAPLITLVGKGICFDSGGMNLKSPEGMRYMKKDMAGAAHVLGLAKMIMAQQLPVRLRVLLAIAENMVAGNSYRPGDIIITRAGISVEVSNTDAEGRLVLCDALTAAAEDSPDLLLDFASLTGAARVAVGPDVAAFFANQEKLAQNLVQASERSQDPLWRLPLYQAYDRYLRSEIADILNASTGPYAGAITAALYLKQFVPNHIPWAHFDVSAWNFDRLPGRPVGGEANGLRAAYEYIENQYQP